MSIHKEGYKILVFGFIVILALNILVNILWPENHLLRWTFLIASLMLYVFILFFFRFPSRDLEPDPGLIYAPADGKVVVIEETLEKEYFKDTKLQFRFSCHPLTCTAICTLFRDILNMLHIIPEIIW